MPFARRSSPAIVMYVLVFSHFIAALVFLLFSSLATPLPWSSLGRYREELTLRALPHTQIVIGTKSGSLLLYDLSSSSLLETIPAHQGPLWSLAVRPDGRGLVTGSADKDVKFWEFEVREIAPEVQGGVVNRVLTVAHTKTLKMTDDVLAVKYSPDGKLLAVSLLDSTVKVFYADTLKFFLSLYGHKVGTLGSSTSTSLLTKRPWHALPSSPF